MTDAELAAIMDALHESKAQLDLSESIDATREHLAARQLGLALEVLAGVVYRMGKRK